MRRFLLTLLLATLSLAAPAPADDATDKERSELAGLLGAGESAGFARATGPRVFAFPADHGPHPEFRNEWWYVTGNLDADDGRRFGFELTFFRFALAPELRDSDISPDSRGTDGSASRWRTNQIYIAHFAVTDANRERFFVAEKYARGALGLAGAEAEPLRVWIDDWELAASGDGRWQLTAADPDFAIDVALQALKPPVLNGVDGLSQKSSEPGNASYYYSITRWQTDGELRIDDDVFRVSGLSWLDREWSTSALGDDQQGWDWFALQLDDGAELMFYNLRKRDGSQDDNSAGTYVAADGRARYVGRKAIDIRVTDTWDSPAGGRYPSGWRVTLPEQGLDLRVTPVMANQELFTTVRYWEGAVDVRGTQRGAPVRGRGYVELTGYAEEQAR